MNMAAHFVICKYCGEKFNRDIEPFVDVGSRRYAHKACADKVNATIPQEEKALLQLMSIWGAQLASSKWDFEDEKGKIRAQYPDAILEKFKQCMIVMRMIAPTNPMAEHYEKILKKASRRRFIAKYKTPLIFLIILCLSATLFLIASILEKYNL